MPAIIKYTTSTRSEKEEIRYEYLDSSASDGYNQWKLKTIQDVDGAQLTLLSGWSTPSGGGKHLVTDYEYDTLGRQNETASPGGTITRTVFDALGRQTKTYAVNPRTGAVGNALAGYTWYDAAGSVVLSTLGQERRQALDINFRQ